MFSKDFLQTVRDSLSMFQLVDRLKGSGPKRLALCPFHADTNPSLNVSARGYRCYVCHARGDVFDWLKATKGVSFVEAVTTAAHMAGLSLPSEAPEVSLDVGHELPPTFTERLDVCRMRLPASAIPEAWAKRSLPEPMRNLVKTIGLTVMD